MITRVAKCHRKTQKYLEGKFTEDDPLARGEIGLVWIATYGMDEYPLRYVSETTWMNFHLQERDELPFQSQLDDYKLSNESSQQVSNET